MTDEPTGTQPGETTEEHPSATGAEQTTPPGTQAKTFTDSDVAAARRDEAAKRKDAEKRLADSEAKLRAFEDAEAERKRAEMSELDVARQDAETARAEAETAKRETEAARVDALRSRLLSEHGDGLPIAYKRMVGGNTEDEIAESLTTARAAYDADRTAQIADVLRGLPTLTPEQIAERYGEPGQGLAERLKGQPVSIGAPSAASGAAPPPAPGATVDPLVADLRKASLDPTLTAAQRTKAWVAGIVAQGKAHEGKTQGG